METMFIIGTLMIGFLIIGWILSDIKIELKYKNKLMEEQNEILKQK